MTSILQEQADRATAQRRELRSKDRDDNGALPGGRICPECGYVSHAPDTLSGNCPACYLVGEDTRMVPR